jgi:prolyl 4-hydroxylase
MYIYKINLMNYKALTHHISLIENFWTKQKCEDFISNSEAIGYEPATVETEKGQKVVETVRNNNRILYTEVNLANEIWNHLKSFAPKQIGNSKAIGLNELFRFYKYEPGQQFKKHIDQSYIRNDTEASYYTFMIYLNDGYEGGQTTFNTLTIQPQQGAALIFLHSLEHEGSAVTKGIKYVLRSDIMFRLEE